MFMVSGILAITMTSGNNPDDGPSSTDARSVTMNRREILGTLGVAGAGFLAGCGGSSPTGNGGGGNGGGSEGLLRFADPERPPTLDPHAIDPTNTNASFAYPEQGYETLLIYSVGSEQIELVPALATEIPSSEDGKRVEFPLREGVAFHTGEEMTAEDVRYSWDRSMTMGLAPGSDALNGSIESMEVVDDYTFRVTLSEASMPVFLNNVITNPAATVISKAAVEENGGVQEGQPNEWVAQNSAGTGPFVLGERTPNSQMWDPHEDYWDETGVRQVEHHFIGDLSSRVSQLGRGDLDYIYISVGDQTEVEGLADVKILSGPQINPGGINFNYNIPYDRDDVNQIAGDDTVPPDFFTDRNVRRAFAHAIPWQTHIDNILGGYGARSNCVHVAGTFGFDPDAPQWKHDPNVVEESLRAAGYWEDGFRITLHNENISEFTNLNLAIKDSFESINDRITINSVQEPEGAAVERHARDPPGWPAEVHGLLPIGTDPTPYYEFFMHPSGDMASRTGVPEHINGRIIELIEQTRTETDQDARLQQFSELQQLTYEEVPIAYGYAPEEVFPIRKCIDGVHVSAWARPHFKHWDMSNC